MTIIQKPVIRGRNYSLYLIVYNQNHKVMNRSRVIYNEPQDVFFSDVLTNRFLDKMKKNAIESNLHSTLSEINSWGNNAPHVKNLLELSHVKDTYVTFEYLVPYNMKRIDCMIYGKGSDSKENVVHIELKQWNNNSVKPAESEGNFDVNDDSDEWYKVNAYTGGSERIVSHPSQQVRGYQKYLEGFISVVSSHEINLSGLAYCYNYRRNGNPSSLYAEKYSKLLGEFRTYSGDEVADLADRIHETLCNGDGFSIFNKMMRSPIMPSRKLMESAADMIDAGNADAFSLIEDQIVAKNMILDKIRNLNDRKRKSVILVKGGPGTGKTVIALNILATLAKKRKRDGSFLNIHFATKSKPLLEGIKNQLPRGSQSKLLFSNVLQFIPANFNEDELDVLLVDEAHRITKSSNNQFTKAEKRTDMLQVDTLLRCAKVSVFFIDDKQAIRYQEIGTSSMITEAAERWNADVEEVELKSQFRCNGCNNYLDWLEEVLYKTDSNKLIDTSFSKEEFDFKVFDSPSSLYDAILEQNSKPGQTARLTAGFCWPWSKTLDNSGNLVKDVHIGEFAMPWETHGEITPPKGYVHWFEWAYKPEGIKQVGCIYTAQGFEFDYIGVIIGKDLVYDKANDRLVTQINETQDPTLNRSRANFDTYVRNIYRVLMSRGMKGCYVYCCDENLAEYFRKLLTSMSGLVDGYDDIKPGRLVADQDDIDSIGY